MPVEQVAYDPGWPARFEAGRAELVPVVGPDGTIEHIGSTSIPGCAAQPIIDILVQLPALPLDWEPMSDLGYGDQMGNGGVNQVFYREAPRTKVHVTQAGSKYAHDRLLFRDYLRLSAASSTSSSRPSRPLRTPTTRARTRPARSLLSQRPSFWPRRPAASAEPDVPAAPAVPQGDQEPAAPT
jgi:hypothetical protein